MATPSHTHGSADLQNSYGPEVSATQHHASQGLEAVAADGLEALPGQRVAAPEYTPYAQQAEKNNDYQNEAAAPATSRKRALGLPFWGVWLLVGLVIIVLGVALGVGLGVGLSNRSSTSASSDASASSPSASPSITTTAQAETTSSTPSTATSSSSASATAAKVKICWNADLVYCNTISVPPDSCINFPSAYNDSVSSLGTGSTKTTCLFYTDDSCTGDYWSTSGQQDSIPAKFNDAFSSVTCDS